MVGHPTVRAVVRDGIRSTGSRCSLWVHHPKPFRLICTFNGMREGAQAGASVYIFLMCDGLEIVKRRVPVTRRLRTTKGPLGRTQSDGMLRSAPYACCWVYRSCYSQLDMVKSIEARRSSATGAVQTSRPTCTRAEFVTTRRKSAATRTHSQFRI